MHVMDSKTLLFVFCVFCRSGCVNTQRMVQPEVCKSAALAKTLTAYEEAGRCFSIFWRTESRVLSSRKARSHSFIARWVSPKSR